MLENKTAEEIAQEIKDWAVDKFYLYSGDINLDEDFRTVRSKSGIDSLDQIELIIHLEDEYDVKISDKTAESMLTKYTLIDIANYILTAHSNKS